jgi:beta-barrel assembly-enhancing protease
MKKHYILLAFLMNALTAFSQDFNDYQPLKNQGSLPSDFTVSPSQKYAKDVTKIDIKDARSTRKTQKDFYLNVNFAIDGLLKSGTVLFETEHATYLKDIMAVLLKSKPEVARKIRVYLLRTPTVNAFATADGIVFVTLGLLAQVENEAQLAYILSHEIVHIDKKHALELVLQSDPKTKPNDRQKAARNNDLDDKSLTKNLFTQDQELEADREGYNLFAKTSYSTKNINRVFDVLKYSELPYDNIVFDRSFLETDYLKIPKEFFLEKVRAIEGINETMDDSESSHPNLFKRRAEINALLAGQKDENKKEYIVSKDRFLKLQKVSRFEIAHLQLHQQLFQDAIYTAFLLKKTEKTEQYPEIITAKALYGLAKYVNNEDVEATAEMIKTDSIEGESQQIYHLFNKMPPKDLTVLATSYVWRMSKKYKKNTDLKNMANDLLQLLVNDHNLNESNFAKALPPPSVAKPQKEKTVAKDSAAMTKIDKITKNQKDTHKDEKNVNKNWWQFAFIECFKDEEFTKTFQNLAANRQASDEGYSSVYRRKKAQNDTRAKGFYLGVPKIVVVNPMYVKVTNTIKMSDNKVDVNLIESEKNVARFESLMKVNAELVGLDLTVLNPFKFEKNDAQKLNDFTLLKEWYYEQTDAESMTINGFRQKEIEELAKKYNTDYFLWTGVIGLHHKKTAGAKVVGALMLPTIVFTSLGIRLLSDKYDMYYYSILYNVKTGKNYFIKSEDFEKKDSDMLLNAHIYDAFLQIKTKKK